jgi:hypothetical protein
MNRRLASLSLALVTALALSPACGKKDKDKATDGTGSGAAGSTGAGGGGVVVGGEIPGQTIVTDCPKSLGGQESVARTITKACGIVVVADNYTNDGTLTLEAGAILAFKPNTALEIGYAKPGKLIVRGTKEAPVVMTAADEKVAGAWRGVWIHQNAPRSQIDGLVIEYAGGDQGRGAFNVEAIDVGFKNSMIKESKDIGLWVADDASVTDFTGNRFDKPGTIALSIPPGTIRGLAAGNSFGPVDVIHVRHGDVEDSGRWQNPGAPIVLTESIGINGRNGVATIEIAAGTELRLARSVELGVGYSKQGALKIAGTKEAPVIFRGAAGTDPGSWRGVRIYGNGDVTIEHAVFDAGGEDDHHGALDVALDGRLKASNVLFRNNKTALNIDEGAKVSTLDGLTFEGTSERAVITTTEGMGKLGAGNAYKGGKERIEILGGDTHSDATWSAQPGAIIEVSNHVSVGDGKTLTLGAGLELRFRNGFELSVGYAKDGTLKTAATKEQPVVLRGLEDEKDAWNGVKLYGNAKSNKLDWIDLVNVAGEAGIHAQQESTGTISNATCTGCAAVVHLDCSSKVTAEGVTPVTKQEGC